MSARFYVDATQAYALSGFLKEISVRVGTPQYIGPVLQWTHAKLSDAFTEHMTAVSKAAPEKFHHVYEWNMIGDPEKKLWRDELRGGGNTRIATFSWIASKTVVPVRQDFLELGVKQIHIFTWKAPVMEFSTDITITPQRGGGLSFFTGPTTPVDKYPVGFTANPITVHFPGGEAVKGSFTREYVDWWAGAGASHLFESTIRRKLERDLADMPLGTAIAPFRAGTRSRTKTVGLMVMADNVEAEMVGKRAADIWLEARSRDYISAAAARAAIISGGSDG